MLLIISLGLTLCRRTPWWLAVIDPVTSSSSAHPPPPPLLRQLQELLYTLQQLLPVAAELSF